VGRKLVPLCGYENSDSGVETPVPALFLGRGCSSTPPSRFGTGASKLGLSAGPSAGSGLSAQDLQIFGYPFGNQYKSRALLRMILDNAGCS